MNAIDSNGYLIATILGPPIAAALVSLVGGATTMILIGILYGAATIAMIGAPDPMTETAGSIGSCSSTRGRACATRSATRRCAGSAVSISLLNLSGGMVTIVVPLIVLDRLHAPEVVVGLVFAGSGVAGMIAALIAGPAGQPRPGVGPARPADGRARRRRPAPARWPPARRPPRSGSPSSRIGLALGGLLNGPMDIGLFTIRQRRTDPAWMGRAFAVSMGFNFIGYPIGAALAGAHRGDVRSRPRSSSARSACVAGVIAAAVLIPRRTRAGRPALSAGWTPCPPAVGRRRSRRPDLSRPRISSPAGRP